MTISSFSIIRKLGNVESSSCKSKFYRILVQNFDNIIKFYVEPIDKELIKLMRLFFEKYQMVKYKLLDRS